MTTQRDPDEILAAWLDEGPARLPDQTRRSIVVAIPTTSQRRRATRVPWRFSTMSTMPKLAVGAVAVIAILLGGVFLLRPGSSDNGIGGAPSLTPAATPSPTPAATPVASATAVASPTPGPLSVGNSPAPLAAGTYTAFDPFPIHMSMTVPDGWSGNIGGPYAVFLQRTSGPGSVSVTIFDDVFVDPCNSDKGFVAPRPKSVNDLAAVLAKMPGVNPTKPVTSTIGGQPAKQLTLTAPTSAGCILYATDGSFPTWELPLGAVMGLGTGQQDRVWITDVDGTRVVIDAQEPVVKDAALHAQIQSILDSLKIQPTGS